MLQPLLRFQRELFRCGKCNLNHPLLCVVFFFPVLGWTHHYSVHSSPWLLNHSLIGGDQSVISFPPPPFLPVFCCLFMLAELKNSSWQTTIRNRFQYTDPTKQVCGFQAQGWIKKGTKLGGKDSVGDPIWRYFQMTKNSYKNMILITVRCRCTWDISTISR